MAHPVSKALYNAVALPLARAGALAASPFQSKIRDALHGRKGWKSRWRQAASGFSRQPVWCHVSSVGEYEQARPVISALKRDFPDIPVVLTFCSPSGYRFALKRESLDYDNNIKLIDYLPIDTRGNAQLCIRLLNPRLIVFVKFDLWPNVIWEANSRGIPTVLIDATLSASSRRHTGIGRRFYRAVYDHIDKILAIGAADADRFLTSAPGHPGVSIAGDTRFDRVMERRKASISLDVDLPEGPGLRILAGSTWPKDEAQILGSLARILKENGGLCLIIAPHEPTTERVCSLISWAAENELSADALSRGGDTNRRVTVIDSVGILAELYSRCDMAYVGGSFSTGVHSVIEPAIMGIPVLFGPVHSNSLEALELLRCGGAAAVMGPEEVYETVSSLVSNTEKRSSMGDAARSYVQSQLGATERCMEAIAEYL